ncbi:phospholipid scramblase 2-like [Drosophila serrata]|uniref:phospholipid scramblase 2-like n=1 Tax=Drosophila serrata TaxID=7274 RepID=UPI000A1D0E84|nr:phospholipid scramblase 2-like [Drosophila serrata]XP_020817074.1 phospholipid scramblase 2-like [Drosophila serrata]XP_020817075.1 phospholipid scramblase 2-like [Drosophila serrata]
MNPAHSTIPLGFNLAPPISVGAGQSPSPQVVQVPQPQISGMGYPLMAPPNLVPPKLPIITQPGVGTSMGGIEGDWKSIPSGIPNCPRGLEYLTAVDQLLVKQKVELIEAFTGLEGNNRYSVKNALGQKVFLAVEDTSCCTRNCFGADRPFKMKLYEAHSKEEVLQLQRPVACSCCLFCCCLDRIEISDPQGNVIGSIKERCTIWKPSFRILDQNGDLALRIEGPFWTCSVCGNIEFQVVSLTGENIGKISKQWSGLAREVYTKADNFGISFPLDLDVRLKAILLGATFLIDFMFYENSRDGVLACGECICKSICDAM